MYPRNFAGVVISDEYDDEQRIVVPDDPFEQVYRAQAYGDDGITDGAEGLGMVQAQRLKAKLGSRRRRLRVGRSPYAVVGGSTFDYGFGVAPLVVVGAATRGVGFVKRLTKTPAHKVAAKQGPSLMRAAIAGDASALAELLRLSQYSATSKSKAIYRKFYDQAIAGGAGRVAAAAPLPVPVSVGPAAPGPVVDAGGAPAPYLPPTPSPISPAAGGGGGPTASEATAAAANGGGGVETVQAGMMGGIDFKNPMVMLSLAGVGLLIMSQFAGGGSGKRRRSRR